MKFVHVTETKCGQCANLRQFNRVNVFGIFKDDYYCCPRNNRMIMVLPEMGERCPLFKPKQVEVKAEP